jgi:hypothetical protein
MKVKIVKCSNSKSWYVNKINKIFEIKNNINKYECYYELKNSLTCLPKCDCILINEKIIK